MEAQQTNTSVNTQTVTNVEEDYLYTLHPALFIKFAEFLGYVSEVIDWCDSWCDGEKPKEHQQKFIEVNAVEILDQMKKDFTIEQIRQYYELFYGVILYEFDDNLTKLEGPASV